MKKFFIELVQAVVLTAMIFGPLFYYFMFVMKP